MSVYDIADHPDFRFRTTDIVIRIGNTEDGALPKEDEVSVLPRGCSLSGWWPQSLTLPPGAFRSRDLKVLQFCMPGWLARHGLETGRPHTGGFRLRGPWQLGSQGLHSTTALSTTQATAAMPRQA